MLNEYKKNRERRLMEIQWLIKYFQILKGNLLANKGCFLHLLQTGK
jgi:hypothetical protein